MLFSLRLTRERYRTFGEFWPFYVFQHMNRTNRRCHFTGTSLVILILARWLWLMAYIFTDDSPFLILLPLVVLAATPAHFLAAMVVGYGFAWAGHFFFEKNRPAENKKHPSGCFIIWFGRRRIRGRCPESG